MAVYPFTSTLYNTPLTDPRNGLITEEWQKYFRSQNQVTAAGPLRLNTITSATVNDAIGVTPITTGPIVTGMYRITAYATVMTVATTSSNLSATVFFTDNSVSKSATIFSGMNGNLTTTNASGTYTFRSDGGANPVSYSTTYASNGANEMAYQIVVILETLQ